MLPPLQPDNPLAGAEVHETQSAVVIGGAEDAGMLPAHTEGEIPAQTA